MPLDPRDRVRRHIEELLAGGPMAFGDLGDALLARGLDLGADPGDRVDSVLESMERVRWVDVALGTKAEDEVVFDLSRLLDGTSWTIPVTEVDLASDTLSIDDLRLLTIPLLEGWWTLDGAGEVDLDVERRSQAAEALRAARSGGLTLPDGWLAEHGARAGSFLVLRVDGDIVRVAAVDEAPVPTAEQAAALAETIDDAREDRRSRAIAEALTEVLLRHPELRDEPMPPISTWIDAAGLVATTSRLARPGFDFDTERLRLRVQDVAESYGMSDADVQGYATVVAALDRWRADDTTVDPDLLARAAAALGDLAVLHAFATEEVYAEDPADLEVAATFGEALIRASKGPDRAGPAWLVAHTMAIGGSTERFEASIDQALLYDPGHALARYDRAWFVFDRGDARRARSLLAELPPELHGHDVPLLDAVLAAAPPAVGRNEPCPCGSGRKYKQCHLGKDQAPLDARLTWLYRKANWWLERRYGDEVQTMAILRAGDGPRSPRQLLNEDPLIPDAVLVEGGRWQQWLDERGSLLPDDEAMLAAQWSLIERSVYEVTAVQRGKGVTVRDVRTGDVVDVDEVAGSRQLKVGHLILVRPLPTGTGAYQFFGGITAVPDRARDLFIELLDGDPTPSELLLLVAESEAPPQVTNSDGHELVSCETTWQVPDVDAAVAELDKLFGPAGDRVAGERDWTWARPLDDDTVAVTASVAKGRSVLGSLTLDGDQLVGRTNSVERADQLREIVEEHVADAVVVEDVRSDLDDLLDDAALHNEVGGAGRGGDASGLSLLDDPQLLALMHRQREAYEQRWVDESIPALGGLTPREALDDPTRRGDLLRLLDGFERTEASVAAQGAVSMRPARLRELLGLPPSASGPAQ